MSDWVTKARAAELLGLTDGQIRSKIARKWTRGVHFAIIDGRTWVHMGEVQAWITREASGQCEAGSKFDTPSMAGDMRRRSTSPRLGLV